MHMARIKHYFDWLFKDLKERKGKYVIAEVPNLPLLIFMAAIILCVISNPGGFQKLMAAIAYLALVYWGVLEWYGGRSRFRKLLGILGLVAVIGALLLHLGV